MRHPALSLSLACIVCLTGLASIAQARVGETKEEFERRLLRPSIGKIIIRERNPDAAKEAELAAQQPFNDVRAHFPAGIRERKYWKSAVPNMLSNENGWRIHAFFQDNISMLEAYQRVGDTLTVFEIENILRSNQGTSEWQPVAPDSLESKASAIGCTYQLADGTLRAKVVGDWFIIYSTKLDTYVKEQLRLIEETRIKNQEELNKARKIAAPGSTEGL